MVNLIGEALRFVNVTVQQFGVCRLAEGEGKRKLRLNDFQPRFQTGLTQATTLGSLVIVFRHINFFSMNLDPILFARYKG